MEMISCPGGEKEIKKYTILNFVAGKNGIKIDHCVIAKDIRENSIRI